MLKRNAHILLGENIGGGIQDNLSGRGRVRKLYGELIAVQILVDGIGIDHVLSEDHINFALFQSQDTGLVIRDDLNGDGLDGRLFTPVVRVCLEDGILIGDKLIQHIWAGSDVSLYAILGAAVFHGFRGDHGKRSGNTKLG